MPPATARTLTRISSVLIGKFWRCCMNPTYFLCTHKYPAANFYARPTTQPLQVHFVKAGVAPKTAPCKPTAES
jgi:hypothetical protein